LDSSRTNIARLHGVGNARRSIAMTCGRSAYVRRRMSGAAGITAQVGMVGFGTASGSRT
jgi:hypothetical protein